MNTPGYLKLNRLIAWVVISLGIIHNVATFTPIIHQELECLSIENYNAIVFFSLGTGSACLLSGVLLLLLEKTINSSSKNGSYSMGVVELFLLIISIVAVICMPRNPFAYIMLFVALAELWVVYKLLQKLKY